VVPDSPPPPGLTPPANLEAEQSVLGAVLLRAQALDQVADILRPEDFYRSAHGHIFQAMLDLWNRGEPVDLVTVTALLRERGRLEDVGGPVFLAALSEHVGTAANAITPSWSTKKRCCAACWNAPRICPGLSGPGGGRGSVSGRGRNEIFKVAESKIRLGFQPIGSLVEKEVANLEAIWHRDKGRITGVASGFPDLDQLTAGFQPGDLIIIAARPSMGKTALALNIAFNAAYEARVPVAFFSLEMSKEQLVRRLLSAVGEIDASRLRRAFLDNDEWQKLQEAASFLLECPMYIDDSPAATVLEVRSKARRLRAENKLGLVIVDYLQLMRGRSDAPSREQEISDISRSLKALAKELECPGHRPVPAQPQGGREA
jgi:replicative DNA helicase